MAGLDENTKMLLHMNGASGSTTITDEVGVHTATCIGSAAIHDDTGKFSESVAFDGDSDYLDIPDSADFDLAGNTTSEITVDFWLKFDAATTGGTEMFVSQGTSTTARYQWYRNNDANLRFQFQSGGSSFIEMLDGAKIQDSAFHHVCFVKSATEYGIYLDGNQFGYATTEATVSIANALIIGGRILNPGGLDSLMDGNVDEFRVQWSNYFGAAPNSDTNDTITVPAAEYSSEAGAAVVGIMTPNSFHWGGV